MDQPSPVSRSEAADALRAISHAQQRSARLFGYQKASPHLILWGIIWVIGFGASGWPLEAWLWPVLIVIGAVGSFLLGRQQHVSSPGQTAVHAGRYVAAFIAIGVFIAALFAIVQPRTPLQADASGPLFVAIAYVLYGIFSAGTRMWITGLGIGVLTVAGFFWLPAHFDILMAIAGGGGLILGGVWLRSL